MSTVQAARQVVDTGEASRQREMKLVLFLASLVVSVAAFVTFDYFYTATILSSAVSGGPHGLCFTRDSVRGFAFQPNCSCIRPWPGNSYEFNTNSLGFRDQRVREVSATECSSSHPYPGRLSPRGQGRLAVTALSGAWRRALPQYEFSTECRGQLFPVQLSQYGADGPDARRHRLRRSRWSLLTSRMCR